MSSGLREHKKALRCSQLIEAAREMVSQRGLDHVTVGEMCERVGVSERTFFNYFATKEDAVLGLGAAVAENPQAETFAAGGPTGDVLADGAHLIVGQIEQLGGFRSPNAIMELVSQEPKLLARHVAWLESQRVVMTELISRREERAPSGVEPVVTSAVLGAIIRAAADLWQADDGEGELAAYVPLAVARFRRLGANAPDPDQLGPDARDASPLR